MTLSSALLPEIIAAIDHIIAENAEAVTELDQAIGDGDHVYNLQRGLQALKPLVESLGELPWSQAWQKIGMSVMTTIGGASGSLYATLFMSLSKSAKDQEISAENFAVFFNTAVEAVKQRGKADAGEKTMLDVLIPVSKRLLELSPAKTPLPELFDEINQVAEAGMLATRDMLATKGRASFLAERSLGHIDAGARTSQLMITAIIGVLGKHLDVNPDG